MMKKDRIVKFTVAVIFISAMVVGGSIAYFRAETASENTMSSTGLKIALMEKENNNEMKDKAVILDDATPGTVVHKELYVKNIKESPLYVRVTLTKYWEKENQKLPELEAKYIELVTNDQSQWIIQDDDTNKEVVYMYYKAPLKTNETTKDFLDAIQIAGHSDIDNKYTELDAKIDIQVDAIQQYAAKDAILSEWGLEVAFNDQGIMQQVEE